MAFFAFSFLIPSSHIRNKDIPINIYRIVQTGPNIQFGGLNEGLLIVVNHVRTEEEVKRAPIPPANWQITIAVKNLKAFMKRIIS